MAEVVGKDGYFRISKLSNLSSLNRKENNNQQTKMVAGLAYEASGHFRFICFCGALFLLCKSTWVCFTIMFDGK